MHAGVLGLIMLIMDPISPMGTIHSSFHIQTERAYCVPTAPMGNVQCLETVHHSSGP